MKTHHTIIEMSAAGSSYDCAIEVDYRYYPIIPGTNESPEEPAVVDVVAVRGKFDDDWAGFAYMPEILLEAIKAEILEDE